MRLKLLAFALIVGGYYLLVHSTATMAMDQFDKTATFYQRTIPRIGQQVEAGSDISLPQQPIQ